VFNDYGAKASKKAVKNHLLDPSNDDSTGFRSSSHFHARLDINRDAAKELLQPFLRMPVPQYMSEFLA
jgi:hypothetical protein